MKRIVAIAALVAAPVAAAPFLVSDPVNVTRITHCVMARGTNVQTTPVEVVTGGVRCHIDLAADPRTGSVSVAFKDNATGEVGPATVFTFPQALPATPNLRIVP